MAFLPSFVLSANSNELAKIANSKLLHTLTMDFVDFLLSGSELAIFCQLGANKLGRKAKNLAETL
jgi:hypothetical protein